MTLRENLLEFVILYVLKGTGKKLAKSQTASGLILLWSITMFESFDKNLQVKIKEHVEPKKIEFYEQLLAHDSTVYSL